MADNLVFEESINTEVDRSEFTQKKWIYVNDNNNGNYTSQIVLDTTPLSNSGGWVNWSEAYIVMPLVVQLTTDTTANSANLPMGSSIADYSWAFKSGFWNLINSMSVEFNNQTIIQQTPFLNVFRSFKALTSWSKDDLHNHGMSCGFYPDNGGSWSYCNDYHTDYATLNLGGRGVNCGYANNSSVSITGSSTIFNTANVADGQPLSINTFGRYPVPITGVAGEPTINAGKVSYTGASNPSNGFSGEYSCNDGMRKRQSWFGYDPVNSNGQGLVNSVDNSNIVFRSCKVQSEAGSVVWKVYAKLRLKDLADFFDKTPLLKGSTIRMLINTNQSIINFKVIQGSLDATGLPTDVPKLLPNSVSVVGGLTNPLMLSSAQWGQGSSPLVDGVYNLSVSIYKNTFPAQQTYTGNNTSSLTSCRIYAPVYTMNALAESKYLALAPTKKIRYKDVFQYQFSGVQGPFNFLVTNGISNLVSVVVVPLISKSNPITLVTFNNQGAPVASQGTLPFLSYQNPVSPSPSMPDPIMINNFNIVVSGVNLFLNNENYDFEAFKHQLASSNQLNGGLTTGLTSGLISEDMFSRGYRYYYGDCSRVLASEENVSRSVQIVGNNDSLLACDLLVFCEFVREFTVSTQTGAKLD